MKTIVKDSTREAVTVWRRLMKFHRPRVGLLALTVLFMMLTAAFNGLSLGMIVPFTEIVLRAGLPGDESAATEPGVSSPGEDQTAPEIDATAPEIDSWRARAEARFFAIIRGQDRMQTLGHFCFVVILVFLLKNIFWYAQSFLSVLIEQRAIRDIRDKLFSHYQALSLDYYQGSHSGVLVSRITNDAELVRGAVANGMMELLRHFFSLLTFLSVAIIAQSRLFIWAILILVPSMFLIDRLGHVLRRISRVSQEKMARVTSIVGETIRGIRIIKAFTNEDHQARRFMRETGDYCRTLIRMTRIGSLGTPLTELAGAVVAVILIYIGGRRVILGGEQPGYLLLFLAAFLSMMRPLKAIHQLNLRIQHGLAAGTRIFDVLDARPSVREARQPRHIRSFERAIRFEDVSFEYEPGHPVLRNLSFEIPRGKVIALVGPSGGGKSTLISLIPRFYDPTRGRVQIDDLDLREIRLHDLRGLIGIVTQETILFHDTIANNIRLGAPHAGDDEIIAAAHTANAHGFIEQLPQQYQTLIGERGLRLSGGERQRITIARAVLKNPPILILDEATSALDTESERLVQDAVHKLLAHRTAIVIAHRLSTIRTSNQIIALADGKIVEMGTHEELLAGRNLYYRLHRMQFADEPVPEA